MKGFITILLLVVYASFCCSAKAVPAMALYPVSEVFSDDGKIETGGEIEDAGECVCGVCVDHASVLPQYHGKPGKSKTTEGNRTHYIPRNLNSRKAVPVPGHNVLTYLPAYPLFLYNRSLRV